MKKVCVVGLGYIGLPTASLLANKDFQVYGVDCVEYVVDTINEGKIHIVEKGLSDFVEQAVRSGNLKAGLEPVEADVFIIAVPTPFKEGKKPDLSYVENAAKEIAPYVNEGNIIILESTSPIGTTERISQWIAQERKDLNINNIFFAHCPERVLPGKIIEELSKNDRIIGGVNKESTERTVEFYKCFVEGDLLKTDARTAELSKLTENAFRDVNIAFANELSMICDKLDINVWELIKLANRHPRVNILQPGPGVGGHCIAVDPWFIVDSAPEESNLISTARNVNDKKTSYVIAQVRKAIKKYKKPVVACLGLAFKPDIDDLRESPAMKIVKELAQSENSELLVVEPNIIGLPDSLAIYENLKFVDLDTAIQRANIVVLLVDHKTFKGLDEKMFLNKILIDTRGTFK
ncbi:UDP-N-acetyl-D-mannosamine dehydrogenase [Anaerosinus sp.]|uniref:UDP-N-acetyl-D-mannosamine dehydrogenase n=1 Tax=Selenobaculum sp. TaxID=3074374 RepID=UPI003AB4EFCB